MPGIHEEMMVFLIAVVSGAIVRLVYQCIRCFRRIVVHDLAAVSVEDMIFWLGSAVYMFVQIYHTSDGSIRWYFILGVALGVILMTAFSAPLKNCTKKSTAAKRKIYARGLIKKKKKVKIRVSIG